ncbi:hypothetical protein JCM15519_03340 [Fundidesulfovibrio butyratiphilus]
MKNFSIFMRPEVFKRLKVLAVVNSVRLGDAVDGLLRLAETSPAAKVAQAMASSDGEAGELVPELDRTYIDQERDRGALPEEF